jgi:hypothetical protein
MQLHLHYTCHLMEISPKNFCIFTHFSPTQNNCKLSCTNSSVSTQSINTNPFSQTISIDAGHTAVLRCTQAHSMSSAHRSYITKSATHWYTVADKNVLPSNRDPWYYNADHATMRALRQSFVLTPAMKVAVDPSVQQPTTIFTNVIKSTNAYV